LIVTPPTTGGYTCWLTIPGACDEEPALLAALAAAGVRLAPGSGFFGARPTTLHLRVSIACVDATRIAEGCRRLGVALRAFLAARARIPSGRRGPGGPLARSRRSG
jgi:DNA-binding transcriptional MocR family regulator